MSDLQKESVGCASLGRNYKKLMVVFDGIPARFKLMDAMRLAGIADSPPVRMAVAAVLRRDFKCLDVGYGSNKFWKKPEELT